MDRFTRNYTIILAVAALLAVVVVFYEDPEVSRLNELLSQDAEVAAYPYRFRVLEIRNGVATMTTPRSADFPAYRALLILYPELANVPLDSPVLLDAQKEMARIQWIARDVVLGSSEVNRVSWTLDDAWLRSEGIDPDFL